MAEYMDSPEFCGQLCHRVMAPEYTAYQSSLHARVPCVDCHIGPGASWLVRSKIDGLRQVAAVAFNTYDRPIPTPVEQLRPARETCEVCHWPERFSGDLARILHRFGTDEANTERTSSMTFNVGGGEPDVAKGIHWHIAANVWYLPLDEKRQDIGWVGVENEAGSLTEYLLPGLLSPEPQQIEAEKRLMDCVDCHSRATHVFSSPADAIDQALARGSIDSSIPFIKKKGVEALTVSDFDLEQALANVRALDGFYAAQYPDFYQQQQPKLKQALAELERIAQASIFPEMQTDWRTHINNIGHTASPGCFRCHGRLVAITGSNVGQSTSNDCQLCHQFGSP